jgi:tRNA-Thr(GGU) m(6)t(6)A37 methyltransferase TsaA
MIELHPIGTIYSPFTTLESMPIQPKGAEKTIGTIELDPRFREGLKDLEGFSHIYLIYHFHKATKEALNVIPFMDTTSRGVYATRSPLRPNHIGLSLVKLLKIEANILTIEGIDILNQTPLLDIKPYIENFEKVVDSKSGWMRATESEVKQKRSDERFI